MRVSFTPEVRKYLREISYILYKKEYFGHLEDSKKYVTDLTEIIELKLPTRVRKLAPSHTYFTKYGLDLFYSTFRKNKRTQWYVFFNMYEDKGEWVYLVCFVANNHTIAQYL